MEGENMTIDCVYNRRFSSNFKAWQMVRQQGPPEILVLTNSRDANFNRAQMGRYVLEDFPTESIFMVTVMEVQRQDIGLYQCVIYLSLQNLVLLSPRFRLIDCKDAGGSVNETLTSDQSGLPVSVIVLACGFTLNKCLVFSVMLIFLRKFQASGITS